MGAPAPVASVDSFWEALDKSGLLSADAFAAARAASSSADPRAVARELVKAGTLTKWQAGQLLHGFHLLTIGKFKLLDQLGSSEIGRVYLAEHSQIGRRHTLNVLAKRHMSNPEVVKQFLADATRACGLDHRNICHTYDVSRDGDRCYVVMEHVEGEDLGKLVERGGKLPLRDALEFTRQAAEGLGHAHENGVVHGNLTPANLLLDDGGTLKIQGIGQSRVLAAPADAVVDESQETPNLASGIFHAPEQRSDSPQAADVASDVYSLGSVLCYLLTGQPPADAAEACQALEAAGAGPEVVEFCGKLMAADPVARPQSMGDVLTALVVAAVGKPLPPMPGKSTKGADSARGKKPPIAKAIGESAGLPIARSLDEPGPSDAPLPGLAVQAKSGPPRGKAKRPPVKAAPAAAALVDEDTGDEAAPAPARSSKTPLIVGGAIAGGVLLLGIVGVLVAVFGFGRGKKPVAAVPKADIAAAAKPAETKNPAQAEPAESNPTVPVEANPEISITTTEPPSSAPATGSSKAGEPPSKAPPASPPTPEPKSETKPMPKPDPPKPEAKPKTEPKAKPKAPPNPLAGLAKAVALPPLPAGANPPPAEALAPLVLGPCKLAAGVTLAAQLKGGNSAIRGGKQKFVLQPQDGASPPQWSFQITGGDAPAAIATLTAKEGNLVFQWTEEGVKHAAQAQQLGNCALDLAAGAGQQVVGLRMPASGPALNVEFERPATARWTLDDLPDPKNVFVELTKADDVPRKRLEPAQSPALGGEQFLWTGPSDKEMFLGLKLNPRLQGRNVQLTSTPMIQLLNAKPAQLNLRLMNTDRSKIDEMLFVITNQRVKLGARPMGAKAEQKKQFDLQIKELTENAAVMDKTRQFIASLKGVGRLQFRVYHQADDAQVDLLVTTAEVNPGKK